MDSLNQETPKTNPSLTDLISAELLLGFAIPPFLVALVTSKVLAETLREIGTLSEEIFRGDRLPPLTFPAMSDPRPDKSESA
ncbi:MAG: hypothetical protein WCA35_14075 [Kovacikia sp.]